MAEVEYSCDGAVAAVTLNRPDRLNAQNTGLVTGLLAGFATARADGARAVVLAGNGRAFCAGHDLHEPEPVGESDEQARKRLNQLQDVTRAIRQFPGVVVAAVHGYALGAGAEFALGCDLVVAADDAVFGFPEVGVGLSVTGGISALLPRIVGPARAKELLLTGEQFSAAQGHAWGLVNRVVTADGHREAAHGLAAQCAALPPIAAQLAKHLLDAGGDGSVAAALDGEVDAAVVTLHSGESDAARSHFAGDAG